MKKRVFLILFLALLLCSPAACATGKQTGDDSSRDSAAERIVLTAEEEAFLQEHPVIRLGVDPGFIPYEFIDSDGTYKGISPDYQQLISERTGIVFEAATDLTWNEAYELAVEGELDVLPCVSHTPIREQYFLFSEPYYTFQRAIFINEDTKNISSINDLFSSAVAVQSNSSHHTYLLAQYPDITLSLYPDVPSAIQAVSDGREKAFIGNFATTNYLIKSSGTTNLSYIRMEAAEDGSQSLYFAVRKDWPLLVSILDKALADIDTEERIAIDNKWLGVENAQDYTWLWQALLVLAVLAVIVTSVSSFWILRLRKEIAIRKKAEDAMKIAKEEAIRANQIKSLFLARMSHEIRTPLNAITGMSYLMKKTPLSPTQHIYVDKLTQASRNMLGIINDILDFSKIEAGKIDIECVAFSMDEILQRAISIASVKVQEQGIGFEFEKDPSMPSRYFGDPARIEQIVMNLLNNAIKFTPTGSVTLSVRLLSRDSDHCLVAIEVADTGIGMTQEQVKRIFTPFDQADSSINRRFGGTGLGLSIVKSLTEMMNGRINVTSEEGKGSRFHIELPLDADMSIETEVERTMAMDCFRNVRCLVIDKNEISKRFLQGCFDAFGIYATYATSDTEAVRLMRKAWQEDVHINLLLIDDETPEGDAVTFATELKFHSPFDEKPKCIMILPLGREDRYDQVISAGIDAAIVRPIVPSILYNQIIELFGIKPPVVMTAVETPSVTPHPYRLLLVEDNKTNQFIAQTILEQEGFRVTIADNGKLGYEYFVKNRDEIDLILMDLHMPVMDGYTAASEIRKIDDEVPIVAMTADAVAGVDEKCKASGMNHYVSKPFDPDRLIATILSVVTGYRGIPDKIDETKTPVDTTETQTVSDLTADPSELENPVKQAAPVSGNANEDVDALHAEDGITRIGGDRVLYRMILLMFKSENVDTMQTLEEALALHDYHRGVEIVHKVKSSSANISAVALHSAASKLQQALQEESPDISPLYHTFRDAFDRTMMEIERFVE